jgi:molybdate transport system substrate-binding protein
MTHRLPLRSLGTILLALSGLLTGCGDNTQKDKQLVILCGSSFVPPTDELIARFQSQTGVKVTTTAAGSEDLLPLVKAGKKGDVLITHDPYLDYTKEANALGPHVEVGFLAPVLAVRKGNPHGVTKIEDLAKPGLKVALPDPQYTTCGEMVMKLLDKKGIKAAVMANVGNRLTKGHSNLGTLLQTGAVDAAILWNGVAHTFKDDLEIVPTPYDYDAQIRVHVIGLSYSKHPKLVEQFVDFARKQGPGLFAAHGYVK